MKIDHCKKVIVPIRSTEIGKPSFQLVFYGLRQPEITHHKVHEALEARGFGRGYLPEWGAVHEEYGDYHRLSIDGRRPMSRGVNA